MNPAETLLTLGELSVALVGFAGYFIGLFWLVMATTMFFTRLVYFRFVTDKQYDE